MNTRLRYIPFEDAVEGMVLGAPLLLTEHGVTTLTLPAGHELSETSLHQLYQRHAEYVCIVEDDPRTDEQRAADSEALNARLEAMFAATDRSQPAMAGLFAAVQRYRSL